MIEVIEVGTAIRVRSGHTSTVAQCTRPEWFAFLEDVQNGKWAHIGHDPIDADIVEPPPLDTGE